MKITHENNKAKLSGHVVSEFKFNHEVRGEAFYSSQIEVYRLSGNIDVIPLMISERLLDKGKNYAGQAIEAYGQFRSYNKFEEDRLELFMFVRKINFLEEVMDYANTNRIFLNGNICKDTIYRKTPLGREIADILLAVNRPYGKADYIPCIAWGRNAAYASKLNVGEHLWVEGRIQSREYSKQVSETETEKRVAYEVSVNTLELVQ